MDTAYKMIEMYEFPTVTADVCVHIIDEIGKGLGTLPQEVIDEMLHRTIQHLHNGDVDVLLNVMQVTIEERDALIALGSDNISSERLYAYMKLVEKMLDMKLSVDQANAAETYLLAEKLFFKN